MDSEQWTVNREQSGMNVAHIYIQTCKIEVDAFKVFQNNGTVRLQPDVISCTECDALVVFVWDCVFATDDVERSVVFANGNVDNVDVTDRCFELSALKFNEFSVCLSNSNALFFLIVVVGVVCVGVFGAPATICVNSLLSISLLLLLLLGFRWWDNNDKFEPMLSLFIAIFAICGTYYFKL